ncbi:MAG: hypothetical protein ABEN55_01755, partial [Bradymonadaceae bacterium]
MFYEIDGWFDAAMALVTLVAILVLGGSLLCLGQLHLRRGVGLEGMELYATGGGVGMAALYFWARYVLAVATTSLVGIELLQTWRKEVGSGDSSRSLFRWELLWPVVALVSGFLLVLGGDGLRRVMLSNLVGMLSVSDGTARVIMQWCSRALYFSAYVSMLAGAFAAMKRRLLGLYWM